MTPLFSFLMMLLSKANEGFWSMQGIDIKHKAEYCDIKWRVYKTCSSRVSYNEFCVEKGPDMFSSVLFNKNISDTIILALPFISNFSHHNVMPMVEALTSRCEFNLIVLDNTIHTHAENILDYPLTTLQVYKDSIRYAKSLNEALKLGLFSAKHLTAMGFSLGAQSVGHVCRQLEEKCGHILAIDAAGPFFIPKQIPLIQTMFPHFQMVSRNDACEVVFLECNGWMMGTAFRTAHKNIIINNGKFQPPCFPGNLYCSHEFCNKLVIDAILNPGKCVATSSKNRSDINIFKPITLDAFTLQVPLREGIDHCNNDESKVFYIATSKNVPKCL